MRFMRLFSDIPHELKVCCICSCITVVIHYSYGVLGFLDYVLSKSIFALRCRVAHVDCCRLCGTGLTHANQRHFAYAAALDCGLKNKHLTIIFYFVVLLVTVAIIFPLKPD